MNSSARNLIKARAVKRQPGSPNRARLYNRPAELAGVNGNSAEARLYRDLVVAIASDRGGIDRLSAVVIDLVRAFAGASILARRMQADIVGGKSVDVAAYTALCGTLVKLSSRIGLTRAMKTVPTLEEYLANRPTVANDAEVDP
jgi:hypothetical protein